MSDIAFKFSWWVYLFIPPINLADILRGWTVLLAVVMAVAWLALGRRRLDVVLLVLALVAAAISAWLVIPPASGALLSGGAAIFVWFAVLLLPVRWVVHSLIRRRAA